MSWKTLIPLIIVSILIAVFAVGLGLKPGEIPSPLIGKPAPAFDLPRLHEPEERLTHHVLAEEPSLLNVWGSWCVACRIEHPLLVEIQRRGEVPIYGLNYNDTRDAATRWLRRFGDPYTATGVDETRDTIIDYGVYGAPETFVIDRAGVIRYKHIGPLTPEVLDEDIMPLIAQLRAEPRP